MATKQKPIRIKLRPFVKPRGLLVERAVVDRKKESRRQACRRTVSPAAESD